MKNTVKFVAVCAAAPVVALGVGAPTAWAEPGTGHSHTNGGPIVDSHTNEVQVSLPPRGGTINRGDEVVLHISVHRPDVQPILVEDLTKLHA
jgi:hypothetical protein